MNDRVEKQVRFAADAIRVARQRAGGFDHRALVSLTEQVKAAAGGPTMKERRSFLKAVGMRLQEEAGASQDVKFKGTVRKQRSFKDPDGDSIHTFGTLLIMIAKRG